MTIYQPRTRKRFGQNFLQDEGIINKIIQVINPKQNQHIIEIGPGFGALTQHLVNSSAQIDAVELDADLIPHLLLQFGLHPNFHIHQADALKFDLVKFFSANQTKSKDCPQNKLRIVGNLPYNISTALIFALLKQLSVIEDMHFMLQKEVVNRLVANCCANNYGRLSVMVQYFCKTESLFDVPPTAFKPAPKVQSAIVRLIPHPELPFIAHDFAKFAQLVKQAFSQRRKTLRNCLKKMVSDEIFVQAKIDANLRAEQISIKQFVNLSNFL